jgi:hypothetical protein
LGDLAPPRLSVPLFPGEPSPSSMETPS